MRSKSRSNCHDEQYFWSTHAKGIRITTAKVQVANQDPYSTNFFQFKKVLVIGLGRLGLPVARYVKQRGFDTYGYVQVQSLWNWPREAAIENATNFSEFDVFILCVSTHKPDDIFSPQIDGLLSIVQRISNEAKSGALVSIESTVPKGTSKKVFDALNHRMHVVHAPHRWYSLEEKERVESKLRVMGSV